jgi:hypothetical protein
LVDELVVYWVWMLVAWTVDWKVVMLAVYLVDQMVAWMVD